LINFYKSVNGAFTLLHGNVSGTAVSNGGTQSMSADGNDITFNGATRSADNTFSTQTGVGVMSAPSTAKYDDAEGNDL